MQIGYGFLGYRGVEMQNVNSMIRFLGYCSAQGSPAVLVPHGNDALVGRARGILATKFLQDTQADVLLCVDSDVAYEPEDAYEIATQAMDLDMVAGLYVTRSESGGITTSRLLADLTYDFSSHEPVEIKWAGGGFVAIHRRVFEALQRHPAIELVHAGQALEHHTYYRTFAVHEEPDGLIELGEDWSICQRAREMGFKVYLNPAVRLKHLGHYAYTIEDLVNGFGDQHRRIKTMRRNDQNIVHYEVEEAREAVPA